MATHLLMVRCISDDLPVFAGTFTACERLLKDFQDANRIARDVLEKCLEEMSLDVSEINSLAIVGFANTGEMQGIVNHEVMRANELLQPA
jgi:hypothetical protein